MCTSSSLTAKVVLLGNSGVGKSSLLLRYVSGSFKVEHAFTIGSSFMTKMMCVRDHIVKLNLWDTAGQERYHSLARMYYQDAQAALLIYDITSQSSYDALVAWHHELCENASPNIVLYVVGNKDDLSALEAVNPQQVKEFCKKVGCKYFRTSAKSDIGVDFLFSSLAEDVLCQGLSQRKGQVLDESVLLPLRKSRCCA